jgi:4-amino-4-deoxy-L-arabinose transferase-like glycosyltransferase
VLQSEREHGSSAPWAWLVLWAAVVPAALLLRPLLPIDETRYLSVAWEMWRRHDWLVPYLNGAPYSDKPPLFFWSILAGWRVLGVNQWWPRLLSPCYSLLSVLLLYRLVRRLSPDRSGLARDSLPFLSGALWVTYSTLLLFDTLLTVCVLLALCGLELAWHGRPVRGWLIYGIGIGLGVLTKGPVVLVHALPVAALGPWWARDPRPAWKGWYTGLLLALLLGTFIALSWALPAAARGGPAYESAILWKQTAGRVVHAFAHRRPWWWYLPLLPVVLFPWSMWPPAWRWITSLKQNPPDQAARFALAWIVPGFVLLSAISGKQVHYLLPLLPGFALLAGAARRQDDSAATRWDIVPTAAVLAALGSAMLVTRSTGRQWWAGEVQPLWGFAVVVLGLVLLRVRERSLQVWMLALVSPALLLCLHLAGKNLFRQYDLRPVAEFLKASEQSGHPMAYLGRYQGEFHFLGRLEHPFAEEQPEDLARWARNHVDGLIVRQERRDTVSAGVVRRWSYQNGAIVTQAATSLVPTPP